MRLSTELQLARSPAAATAGRRRERGFSNIVEIGSQ
jgi:hypothetical protein